MEPVSFETENGMTQVVEGLVILIDVAAALHDAKQFEDPGEFRLGRNAPLYPFLKESVSINGKPVIDFQTRLSHIAITGMIKHCAHLSNLRVAHDAAGRLKRVTTPSTDHLPDKYMTTEWDGLVNYPSTWNVRFDGVGSEVSDILDNADQGHSGDRAYTDDFTNMEQLWRAELRAMNARCDQEMSRNDTAPPYTGPMPEEYENGQTLSESSGTVVAGSTASA